jgi:putative acetyltransferase
VSESDAPGNGVALRPYDPTDEADAIELWRRSWQAAYPEIDFSERLEWWRERWRSDTVVTSSIVVAARGAEIVGFVTVNGRTGYLDQLVVAPEAWGTPTAVLLLDQAKRESPRGLDLHVNVDNGRALRFYEKHGFERVSESINPRSGRPVYLMRWLP